MSRFVVGLTGGIGSGKTTVTDIFQRKGIKVIDADIVAREVVAPGQPALKQIAEHFGQGILDQDGSLNRRQLRELVFNQEDQKDWLNQLLHPLIRDQMLRQCAEAKSVYCILSAPLLLENNLAPLVARVLLVDITEQNQLIRAASRDNSDIQQIKNIMQAQASREERLAVADDIINNDGSMDDLPVQIDKLHQKYIQLAQAY